MESLPRLITIPLSHYCERARWALDHTAIEYREEPHLPLFHLLHTARVGCRSVPVLVMPSEVVRDSQAIVQWAKSHTRERRLYPADPQAQSRVLEIERHVDRQLGSHVRRWAYSHLLDAPALLAPCFSRGVSRSERFMTPLVVKAVRPLIRRSYRVDKDSGRTSLARAETLLAEVGQWLSDGRRYLAGEQFTAADLTFAALGAPLVCPPQYGGTMPPLDALPAAMRSDIERLRATRAGAFILRLYELERARA